MQNFISGSRNDACVAAIVIYCEEVTFGVRKYSAHRKRLERGGPIEGILVAPSEDSICRNFGF